MYGQIDTVDYGTTANDGTGDPLRTAMIKINNNDLYLEDVTDTIKSDTVDASDVFMVKSDVMPQLVFVRGGALAGDTIAFSDDALAGSLLWSGDTMVITSINGVMQGASVDSCKGNLQWHATLNSGSATELRATDFKFVSTGTGTSFSSGFSNTEIPPGVRIWWKFTQIITGAKPTYFELTVNGYRK